MGGDYSIHKGFHAVCTLVFTIPLLVYAERMSGFPIAALSSILLFLRIRHSTDCCMVLYGVVVVVSFAEIIIPLTREFENRRSPPCNCNLIPVFYSQYPCHIFLKITLAGGIIY